MSGFDLDLVPNLQEVMSSAARSLRKQFCVHFSSRINSQLRKYFKLQKEKTEPRDIKAEFFEIALLLKQAATSLDMLTVGHLLPAQRKATALKQGQQVVQPAQIRKPELLVRSKKFNQMEMEMDKFLAKKHQISNQIHSQMSPHEIKSSILQSIIHITLKSLYESVRLNSFSLFGFQQLQTDCHFLFLWIN